MVGTARRGSLRAVTKVAARTEGGQSYSAMSPGVVQGDQRSEVDVALIREYTKLHDADAGFSGRNCCVCC